MRSASGAASGVEPRQLGRCARRPGQAVARAATLAASNVVRLGQHGHDTLRVARQREPRSQLVDLALARAGGLDLAGGVFGQLQPALISAGSISSSRSAASFARSACTASATSSRRRAVTAVRVEHVALPRTLEQPLLIVLAVDLDQRIDQLPRGARR